MTDTQPTTPSTYEALYQRKEFAPVSLLLLVVAMLGTIALALTFIESGNNALRIILSAIGLTFVAIFVALPFGAGYMLHKSLKRRRRVLSGQASQRAA